MTWIHTSLDPSGSFCKSCIDTFEVLEDPIIGFLLLELYPRYLSDHPTDIDPHTVDPHKTSGIRDHLENKLRLLIKPHPIARIHITEYLLAI